MGETFMAFMAMLFGSIVFLLFIFGCILCLLGLTFLILYFVKKQTKKVRGFLIAAVVLLALGIPTAVGIPVLITVAEQNAINERFPPQTYPVINAIARHDNSKLEELLRVGADPNEVCEGFPALYWTTYFELGANSEAAQLLLSYNAAYDFRLDWWMEDTTLMKMILNGTIVDGEEPEIVKIVNLLINHGYDVNETDENGITLLMYANKHASYEAQKTLSYDLTLTLVSHGAMVNTSDNMGRTPLMWACGGVTNIGEVEGFASFDYEAIKYLIEAGADLSAKDHQGYTAYDYFKTNETASEEYAEDNSYFREIMDTEDYAATCASIEALLQGE